MKTNNKLVGVGFLTAIAASLCCITPVLAIITGLSGSLASTFSWLDPFRPYFIGLTVLVFGFAWYQKLRPKNKMSCDCEESGKPKFIQSKFFLAIMTVFTALIMAFPLYSTIFYPKSAKQVIVVDKSDIQTVEFKIGGMTCSDCENPIHHEYISFLESLRLLSHLRTEMPS